VQRDDAGRIVRGNVEFHNAPAFERHSF
jgi:hypothetical protein